MKSFKFVKDIDTRWYIDLPDWDGLRSELEMVCGADTMLDILAQGEDVVNLTLSLEPFDHTFELHFIKYESGGGTYLLTHPNHSFEVWLCHVTEFVFGHLPTVIYAK